MDRLDLSAAEQGVVSVLAELDGHATITDALRALVESYVSSYLDQSFYSQNAPFSKAVSDSENNKLSMSWKKRKDDAFPIPELLQELGFNGIRAAVVVRFAEAEGKSLTEYCRDLIKASLHDLAENSPSSAEYGCRLFDALLKQASPHRTILQPKTTA